MSAKSKKSGGKGLIGRALEVKFDKKWYCGEIQDFRRDKGYFVKFEDEATDWIPKVRGDSGVRLVGNLMYAEKIAQERRGIYWDSLSQNWTSKITVGGRSIVVGKFPTIPDALAAQKIALEDIKDPVPVSRSARRGGATREVKSNPSRHSNKPSISKKRRPKAEAQKNGSHERHLAKQKDLPRHDTQVKEETHTSSSRRPLSVDSNAEEFSTAHSPPLSPVRNRSGHTSDESEDPITLDQPVASSASERRRMRAFARKQRELFKLFEANKKKEKAATSSRSSRNGSTDTIDSTPRRQRDVKTEKSELKKEAKVKKEVKKKNQMGSSQLEPADHGKISRTTDRKPKRLRQSRSTELQESTEEEDEDEEENENSESENDLDRPRRRRRARKSAPSDSNNNARHAETAAASPFFDPGVLGGGEDGALNAVQEQFIEKQRQMLERLQRSQRKSAQSAAARKAAKEARRAERAKAKAAAAAEDSEKAIRLKTEESVRTTKSGKRDKSAKKAKKKKRKRERERELERQRERHRATSTSPPVVVTNREGNENRRSSKPRQQVVVAPFMRPLGPSATKRANSAAALVERLNLESICNLLPRYFPLKKRLRYLDGLQRGDTAAVVAAAQALSAAARDANSSSIN